MEEDPIGLIVRRSDDDDEATDDPDANDNDSDSDVLDAAEFLMRRGDRLRVLREMERQDELERQRVNDEEVLQQQGELAEEEERKLVEDEECSSSSTSVVLDYDAWLQGGQRYHDDLKHVDYKYIDFGTDHWDPADRRPLIVEQDKSLGKGGFCWDAAYILGEYLSSSHACLDDPSITSAISVIELGAGTGLCGMMIAKARPHWNVTLTDLPRLMPLLTRNVALNFDAVKFEHEAVTLERMDVHLSEHVLRKYGDKPHLFETSLRGHIHAQVLEWSEDVDPNQSNDLQNPTFDVIAGADVVASIYNPIALALTIHRLAHADSVVYISFKERLSSIHRQFEGQLSDLFEDVQIVSPAPHATRNRNRQVHILVARRKKKNCLE